jgi:hypothetical protein
VSNHQQLIYKRLFLIDIEMILCPSEGKPEITSVITH